eukprot:405831-Amphidinium_carterae.3
MLRVPVKMIVSTVYLQHSGPQNEAMQSFALEHERNNAHGSSLTSSVSRSICTVSTKANGISLHHVCSIEHLWEQLGWALARDADGGPL